MIPVSLWNCFSYFFAPCVSNLGTMGNMSLCFFPDSSAILLAILLGHFPSF